MDNWITFIAVYVIVWTLVLFMVLPFGVRRPEQDELVKGQEPGAPVKPMIWRKLAATSVISLIVCVIFYYIGEWGWVSFRPDTS